MLHQRTIEILLLFFLLTSGPVFAQTGEEYSGIYPHLAFFNDEQECGTGVVVPWADRLWSVTYAPHAPNGSTDKLLRNNPRSKTDHPS